MAKLVKLEIKNFRGIKELTLELEHTQNIVCLIGRVIVVRAQCSKR